MSQADAIERCQQVIDYRFSDPGLLALALTHASAATVRLKSNERLEFLGDAVLDLVVCQRLYEQHEELAEGQMTKIKSAVVSRQTCAAVADKLGLTRFLVLGKGVGPSEALPSSVAAAVVESIIGAVYLDGGLAPAARFVLAHVQPHIDEAILLGHQRNYKSMLQQLAQRVWGATPDYHLLDEKGPDHSKAFELAVSIDGRQYPSAWGPTKKDAEQEAARRTLVELGELDADDVAPPAE